MIQSSALRETLRLVGQVMRDASDDWWVIASAAAALHGVQEPEAADVDVLASDRDVLSVLERLKLTPLATPPHPLFRSRILGQWPAAQLMVEFMAGFEYRTETGWRLMTLRTREPVELGGVTLFIPSRHELAEMMTALGRPKDLARARHLTPR